MCSLSRVFIPEEHRAADDPFAEIFPHRTEERCIGDGVHFGEGGIFIGRHAIYVRVKRLVVDSRMRRKRRYAFQQLVERWYRIENSHGRMLSERFCRGT